MDLKLDEEYWYLKKSKLPPTLVDDQSSDEKEPVLYDSYSANVDIFLVVNVAEHLKIDIDFLDDSISKHANVNSYCLLPYLTSSWACMKGCKSREALPSNLSASYVGRNICFFRPGSPLSSKGSPSTGSYPSKTLS